ncbi:hypothetical protein JG688_00015381 [Phytophthora aleatoria]|uniref:Ubiquitin-like protease family profile domain-containing protein n=1 Tax=Phytophthora aleatoria TaxID=2496075 RepID=A0A8J5LWW6_9STRA|nr:hypothetical protein JG688_00015381 [Phytophthora aleatoria]
MTTLQDEYGHVGVILPSFSGLESADTRLKVINGSELFREHCTHVLLPIHVNENHWCGAVFDFTATPNKQKSKQIDTFEALIKELFPEMVAKMEWTRDVQLKQADGHSCGPLVLLLFSSVQCATSLSRSHRQKH